MANAAPEKELLAHFQQFLDGFSESAPSIAGIMLEFYATMYLGASPIEYTQAHALAASMYGREVRRDAQSAAAGAVSSAPWKALHGTVEALMAAHGENLNAHRQVTSGAPPPPAISDVGHEFASRLVQSIRFVQLCGCRQAAFELVCELGSRMGRDKSDPRGLKPELRQGDPIRSEVIRLRDALASDLYTAKAFESRVTPGGAAPRFAHLADAYPLTGSLFVQSERPGIS